MISLLMMLLGSLFARWIHTDFGSTSVTEVTISTGDGHLMSAFLYMPEGVSPQTPAPGIAMWHGLNNSKEYMSNTALEMARRGYVVVSADMTGHGSSNGANQDIGCGGPATLTYLQGVAGVDTSRIGLVGMSQGGFCAATSAALSQPDGYSSIFYMESEPNPPGPPFVDAYMGMHNMAWNIGRFTELGIMIAVDKGDDATMSPALLPLFGTDGPIVPDQVYGSIAEGTARILYTPYEEHAMSTDSVAAIGNAIEWMNATLGAGTMGRGSQIWPLKLLGTTVALFGGFLFLFAMGGLLLRTRKFSSLVKPVPEYRGLTGGLWWVGAVVTTALGPLLYLWIWDHMFGNPWIKVNTLWPQSFTNIYMVWAVLIGVIAWALIALNHYTVTKRQGATLDNYGITEPGSGIDWSMVLRSVGFVFVALAPLYLLLAFVKGVWHVDFRMWVVNLQPMTPARWLAFFGYLVPFGIYFFAQGILFNGFLRWKKGKAPQWQEMLVNSIMLTFGALVWILILYIPLMSGGNQPFGTGSAASAGLGGIYYLPLLVFWPLVSCLYTFFFRKTGRIWVGATMVTVYMVWTLAASGDFAIWRILG
ncbi:MAG: CocE/NonD family hydrolase [Acidimicrobiia bacterium]